MHRISNLAVDGSHHSESDEKCGKQQQCAAKRPSEHGLAASYGEHEYKRRDDRSMVRDSGASNNVNTRTSLNSMVTCN